MIMTGGGPANATMIWGIKIYKPASPTSTSAAPPALSVLMFAGMLARLRGLRDPQRTGRGTAGGCPRRDHAVAGPGRISTPRSSLTSSAWAQSAGTCSSTASACCWSLFSMLPLLWGVSTALKVPSEVYAFPPTWIPKTHHLR